MQILGSGPARDFAIATVVVANTTPKLPNTGFPPEEGNALWNIIGIGIFALVSTSFVIFLRKNKI